MGRMMNILLVLSFFILIGLIGVNYYADKELNQFHINPSSVERSTENDINSIINTATTHKKSVGSSRKTKIQNNKNRQKGAPLNQIENQNSAPPTSSASNQLPTISKNIDQTYFNSSKN